jgi:hypothetical protein
MKAFNMWTESAPWLHVLEDSTSISIVETIPPPGVTVVARLNGANMATPDGVFEQFSDALRFPAYFGWNIPALSECLRDLNWIPADQYLIVIKNPGQLLVNDPKEREVLLDTLLVAAKAWASPIGKISGVGIPFNVLFICGSDEISMIRREVSRYQK